MSVKIPAFKENNSSSFRTIRRGELNRETSNHFITPRLQKQGEKTMQ